MKVSFASAGVATVKTRLSQISMRCIMKLSAPGRIEINRETIEDRLGREWETGEFQLAIVTYTGNFAEWDDDQIIVAWDH